MARRSLADLLSQFLYLINQMTPESKDQEFLMTCLRGYVLGLYVDEFNRYLMIFIPIVKDRVKNKNIRSISYRTRTFLLNYKEIFTVHSISWLNK